MNYTQEQFDKLPKWAQSELNQLNNSVKILKSKLDVFEGKVETNTSIRDGLNRSFLPNNTVVDFKTGKNLLNTVSVYVRSNGQIDINTDSRLSEDMVILPRAANSFYVAFVDNL